MAKKKSPPPTDFDIFLKKVGERMRQLRIKKGFTNYENFAYEHDLGRSQYGKYENGTEDLRLSSLYKVISSMEVSFEEFFSEGFDS
jgi:transcriptional regulator with XRE-family HTH domain